MSERFSSIAGLEFQQIANRAARVLFERMAHGMPPYGKRELTAIDALNLA
jgi:hypothetical protein